MAIFPDAKPGPALSGTTRQIFGKRHWRKSVHGLPPVLRIRIRDTGLGAFLTPGSGIRDGRKSASGSVIQDEQSGSYFLELRTHFFAFFGVKILKFFDEDQGSGMETVRIWDPGWKKVGSGIRDKHPGAATLLAAYPAPARGGRASTPSWGPLLSIHTTHPPQTFLVFSPIQNFWERFKTPHMN